MALSLPFRSLLLPAALMLAATALAAPAQASTSADADADLAAVKSAHDKYQDVEKAVADGFVATDVCATSPEGTMGYHYVHPERLKAPVEMLEPPVLVYQPSTSGDRKLVAVEWVQPDADQDLSTDEDKPSLFDHPFDGPMEGHEPGMPKHYDLHAWLWQHNPSGTLKPWNPAGSCETADGQVSEVPVGGTDLGGGVRTGGSDAWLLGMGAAMSVAGVALVATGRRVRRQL